MKTKLRAYFIFVLIAMLAVTTWASLQENIFDSKILLDPWGIATMFDTYFGFLAFYLWVAYKENTLLKRVIWFVAIMALGNIAMAGYVLLKLHQLDKNASFENLLLRNS